MCLWFLPENKRHQSECRKVVPKHHRYDQRDYEKEQILPLVVWGPVCTKRQRQLCNNSAMMLAILFSLQIMELLEIGIATHSGAIALFSMRIKLLGSSQSCCSIDAHAPCEQTLNFPKGDVCRWIWSLSNSCQRNIQEKIYCKQDHPTIMWGIQTVEIDRNR